MTHAERPLPDPTALLLEETPLRVWSLIITIFGDVVMKQGTDLSPEPIWTSDLMAILDGLGIEAGVARTNLSRLVANGTLLRDKNGRNTLYRLSQKSCGEFVEAARHIYGSRSDCVTTHYELALIDRCVHRSAAKAKLITEGWRFFNGLTAMAPAPRHQTSNSLPDGVIIASAEATPCLNQLARSLWNMEEIDAGYLRFVANFTPILNTLPAPPPRALALRIVAVHRFRRLVLKDPHLPTSPDQTPSPRSAARTLFDALNVHLANASEGWLHDARTHV